MPRGCSNRCYGFQNKRLRPRTWPGNTSRVGGSQIEGQPGKRAKRHAAHKKSYAEVSICLSKRNKPVRFLPRRPHPFMARKRTNRSFSQTQGNKSRKIKLNIWPRKNIIASVEGCWSDKHNEVPHGANGWVVGEKRGKEWVICIT